jgi:hypothetical protein
VFARLRDFGGLRRFTRISGMRWHLLGLSTIRLGRE